MLRLALNRHVQLCASEVILEEAVRAVAKLFEATATLTVSGDDADNRFLECAEAAKADCLVTGNIQHFPAAWGRTRVITARQLIELVTPKR